MLVADPDHAEQAAEDAPEFEAEATDAAFVSDGPLCNHCQKPLPQKATVCPSCGFYPSLGRCIELDADWERLAGIQAMDFSVAAEPAARNSHMQVWRELVPEWGWQLIGYNVLVLMAGIAARIMLPEGVVRTAWSLGQLVVGAAAICTCHCLAYFVAIAEDASMNIADIVIKPVQIWKQVIRELPKSLRIVAGATCGATAVLTSILIIGSLNYAVLLDWGFKQPPKQNLLGAIAARAQQVGASDDDSLEDAMNEFVDKAGVTDEIQDEGPKLKTDCLIIGYTTAEEDPQTITSLVLAQEHLGTLMFIGTIRGGFDEELHQYLEQFREVPRQQPFVNIPIILVAHWIQPYFTCRVKYVKKDQQSGRLDGMEYDTMLGRIGF